MKKHKWIILGIVLVVCVGILTACGKSARNDGSTAGQNSTAGNLGTKIEELATDAGKKASEAVSNAGKGASELASDAKKGIENASSALQETISGR